MFQWNQNQNSFTKNRFHQNQGSIIIGTPGLILGASSCGMDNSIESLQDPSPSWVCAYQLPSSSRGNQIVSQNCLILDGIHFTIDFNQCPWTKFHCWYVASVSMLLNAQFGLIWPHHLHEYFKEDRKINHPFWQKRQLQLILKCVFTLPVPRSSVKSSRLQAYRWKGNAFNPISWDYLGYSRF